MPLLSLLLSHYWLTSQIILHKGEFVAIEESLVHRAENENVFLDLVFFSIVGSTTLVDVQLALEALLEVFFLQKG